MAIILKKTLVLKPNSQNSSFKELNIAGLIKLEFFNDKLLGSVNVTGITQNDLNCLLIITDGIKNLNAFNCDLANSFNFETRGFNANNVCALIFLLNDIKQPLSYGIIGARSLKLEEYIYYYAQNYEKKQNLHVTQKSSNVCDEQENSAKNANDTHSTQPAYYDSESEYDDEAIATENYYANENFCNFTKNTVGVNNELLLNQTSCTTAKTQEQTEKIQDFSFVNQDKTSADNYSNANRQPNFYESVKEKLDKLFGDYPPFLPLSETVPLSKWIKIDYSNQKHYVVGIIFKNQQPAFIAYGIPGIRTEKPKEFCDYPCFIPANPFNFSQSGYWCIFQSALDGQIQSPNN